MKIIPFSSENAEKVHYARNILYNFKYSIHGIFLENNVAFTKASNYDLYIYLAMHSSIHLYPSMHPYVSIYLSTHPSIPIYSFYRMH